MITTWINANTGEVTNIIGPYYNIELPLYDEMLMIWGENTTVVFWTE